MGKKVLNPKLNKRSPQTSGSMLSAFNKFANRLVQAKRKKVQKVGDTKQRLMESKKTNRMLKVSKRSTKFALLEDNQQQVKGLTHRGKNINEIKEFNDMNFGSEVDDEDFQKMHENLNFTGFDEEEQAKVEQSDRPKSKTEVYKEIIEKSKLHKHLRQELYEQNFEKAVELDDQFPSFVNKLQFRTRDSNVRERLSHHDHQFEKLANELKDEEKVVSNKVIEKNQKYTDKIRKKKTEQLNQLMKDSSGDEADIRGWVKNANKKDEQEEEQDEIDDIELSSGEQGEQDSDMGEDQDENQSEVQSDDQDQDQLSEQSQEQAEVELPSPKKAALNKNQLKKLAKSKR